MKTWNDGDYVYAADLDDLIGNSNMVFANAAQRDAYLVGALAPTPGMHVHMLDDGITYKRISYGGTDYWVPPPDTHLVTVTQTTAQSAFTSGTQVQLTTMTTFPTRNFGNYWASDKFTPLLPGYYQFDACVVIGITAADGYRAAWLSLNGASTATAITGSWNQLLPTDITQGFAVHTRTVCMFFTGTGGQYITLMCMHNSSTAQGTYKDGTNGVSSFTAKYLGWG